MDTTLAGKAAVITGAGSGMGQATAEAFAGESAIFVVHSRTAMRVKEASEVIGRAGGEARAVAGDLVDPTAIEAMCADALPELGSIDILVGNAGIADMAAVVDMDEALWDRINTGTNLKAPFLVTGHIRPAMLARDAGGCVLYNVLTNDKIMACAQI